VRVHLPVPASFSFDAVVRSHGWYDLPPFAYDRAERVLDTFVGTAGRAVPLRIRSDETEIVVSGNLARGVLASTAHRILSLDLDLSGFAASVAGEANLSRALARGGGRMLRAPTIFEDAVKMLFTTNCSWAATRGMVTRLIALAGAGGSAFPTPTEVARFPAGKLEREVRCGYRAVSLARFARRVASGRLDLSRWEDRSRPAADIREAILEEHGFGPYAAEGILRILGRHDFLALDSWVRMKYRQLHPGPKKKTDASIARRYARYGEQRGLAMWLELTEEWHRGEESVWP
jgi:N-glycosylase/DNA lyase